MKNLVNYHLYPLAVKYYFMFTTCAWLDNVENKFAFSCTMEHVLVFLKWSFRMHAYSMACYFLMHACLSPLENKFLSFCSRQNTLVYNFTWHFLHIQQSELQQNGLTFYMFIELRIHYSVIKKTMTLPRKVP